MQTFHLVNDLNMPLERFVPGDVYVTPDGTAYQLNESGEMGGFMDILGKITGLAAPLANFIPGAGPVIATALSTASGALQTFGGSNSGQAKGLAGITAFGNQVMSELNKLAGMVGQATKREIDFEADKLVSYLSNDAMVYPAKKGNDAAALSKFKQDAAALAAQIKEATANFETQRAAQQRAQPTTGGSSPVSYQTLPSGQIVAVPAQSDNTMLYVFGGAIVLILLLKN